MAAPIQSPAKCDVRPLTRFLNAKGERKGEFHEQIVAVYGNFQFHLDSSKTCKKLTSAEMYCRKLLMMGREDARNM